jgi:ABC-type multidrug transport system fused ATPase/permease subunit
MTVALIIRFITAIAFVPIFSIPAILIAIVGGILGEVYMHSQLSVKREMSNAKSPLFSHFASALTGIVSIRAYGAEE